MRIFSPVEVVLLVGNLLFLRWIAPLHSTPARFDILHQYTTTESLVVRAREGTMGKSKAQEAGTSQPENPQAATLAGRPRTAGERLVPGGARQTPRGFYVDNAALIKKDPTWKQPQYGDWQRE